jgi:multimeric flavodoxin WrbA
MKATIFDGSPAGDPTGERIADILSEMLTTRGYETEHVVLRDKRIANCSGCFGCWLKTPGLCLFDDDNRKLSTKFIASDLAILLSPVAFGAYSPELKRMLDHFIANISPFFTTINGESHHQKRYVRYPDLLVIGWSDEVDERAAAMFRHLAWRNSINFHARRSSWEVVKRTDDQAALAPLLDALFRRFESTEKPASEPLPHFDTTALDAPPRNTLLLVGSPRQLKSSSASIGGYLLERLQAKGIKTETVYIHRAMQNDEKLRAMCEAIDNADLCLLAFPLYIDSLPAPVLSAMREIARHRAGTAVHGGLATIANCGFIESHHNEHALATCAAFAHSAGLRWLGGIPIGGGEGLIQQKKLSELGVPAIPYKKALDQVADAISAGSPVPDEARKRLAKPFIPAWIYRLFGSMRWKKEARQHGVRKNINAKPYRQVAG